MNDTIEEYNTLTVSLSVDFLSKIIDVTEKEYSCPAIRNEHRKLV